jgi:hypothetical protein
MPSKDANATLALRTPTASDVNGHVSTNATAISPPTDANSHVSAADVNGHTIDRLLTDLGPETVERNGTFRFQTYY